MEVYFWASGITGKVAEKPANAADTDLYKRKPEKAYPSADLD